MSVIPCDTKTVKYWIERYKHNQDLSDNFKDGPKPKISESKKQKLIHLVANNKLSTRSIAEVMNTRGVSICNTNVYNYLKLSNLKYQKPLKKRLINEVHKNKRFI